MRKMPSLSSLRAFEAASRRGSVLNAAMELGVTPSAVSHQIQLLERELGLKLFHRAHRSIVLTDGGREYAAVIGEAFAQIEAASRMLGRDGKGDILTVHSVPSIATQWLMPRISRFTTLNPGIDVRLNASPDPVDLANGRVDIDIRYGATVASAGVRIEPFPEEPVVVLCSPKMLDGPDPLRSKESLRGKTLIHSEINLFGWRDWARINGVELDLSHGPRFDRSFMAISAAADCAGVCLESALLVQREIQSGSLVMPFAPERYFVQCHSFAYLQSKAKSPKIAAFRGWLLEALNEPLHDGSPVA